ncbi:MULTISPECIES: 5-oxoprolinase subunit B family protein [Dietzia]|uniref:Carboxyltransferase domain-containing protein n=1 Tax=Dietzia maris TaxID=37915 RepID=A0ABT8GZG4_9ACTN|nr:MULTISPECIES: carboxyltransferase domain-containing protein [Dietzia]MDJ0422933.1 carboxyltransferase domain-containing protein [Dietzia kunjamensis]MDN4505610.1 carboxyltransferase domain-containing protein [Dietzia maris]
MTTTRIRRCGETALLLDCADLAEAVSLAARIEQWRPDALDVVAAARTVLVTVRDSSALPELRRRLVALLADPADQPVAPPPSGNLPASNRLSGFRIGASDPNSGSVEGVADFGDAGSNVSSDAGSDAGAEEGSGAGAEGGVAEVTIDVRYDGPDLAAVADLAGMSTEALVRTHTSITWRAAFGGFAPGFFYLVDARELGAGGPNAREPDAGGAGASEAAGGPSAKPALPAVPRLGTPRARVPAGAVGLADRFCAVYPGASPGGWQLLGTTDARLWDLDRPDPALLAPGMTVRFREVGGRSGDDRGRSDQRR